MRILFAFFLLAFSLIAQAQQPRYPEDLARFKYLDSISPAPKNALLFIGSSSFKLWTDVQDYFPGYPILNRAYGGSCLTDLVSDFNDILKPYHPGQIVIYCGENDFASDTTLAPEVVADRFKVLYYMIRQNSPGVKITYVSMKPSPSRWFLKDKVTSANRMIKGFLKKQRNASFVNIWDRMLDQQGEPDKDLFLEDHLHMNSSGYAIWQKAISKHLIKKSGL